MFDKLMEIIDKLEAKIGEFGLTVLFVILSILCCYIIGIMFEMNPNSF